MNALLRLSIEEDATWLDNESKRRMDLASGPPPFASDLSLAASLPSDALRTGDEPIPACPPDCARIVSYNVFCSSPILRPEPFARVFKALNPDVLLLQEWDGSDAVEMQDWFDRHMPLENGRGHWRVMQSAGRGVAVVSRHPIRRLGPYRLEIPEPEEAEFPSGYFGRMIGYVGAIAQSPIGSLGVASVHLTCCGGPNSIEDRRRIAEALLINRALRNQAVPRLVLAGDFNLVGTAEPLRAIGRGLSCDGASLAIANPKVWGSDSGCSYTWRNSKSNHNPSRHDWLLHTAETGDLDRAFILDCSRLSDSALRHSGLGRHDTDFSDHLPMVADVSRFRKNQSISS